MSLRPAFVITTLTTAACTPTPEREPVTGVNPPVPVTVPSATGAPIPTTPAPEATVPAPEPTANVGGGTTPPLSATGSLNPSGAEGRTTYRAYQGDGCFVYLPFPPLKPGEQRVPGTAPPMQPAECPPRLLDPAYESCRGGQLNRKPDGVCECFQPGNPPRVRPNDCPSS